MAQNKAPRYLSISHIMQERITQSQYAGGEKLPSESALAQEFGVSLITVKKALDCLATDGLIRKIQGKGSFVTMEETIANTTSRESSRIVGLVVDDFLVGFGAGIVDSMEREAEKRGYTVVSLRSCGKQARESAAIDTLLQIGAEALVITPVHGEYYNQKILKLVLENFPVVFLDRRLDGIPAPFIASDNVTAAREALDYLYSMGHRRTLLVTPTGNANSLLARRDGISAFCAIHPNMECTPLYLHFSPQAGTERENVQNGIAAIKEALSQNAYTAVFCMQHKLALMAQQAARAFGLSIPQALSIICFDENYDIEECQFFTHMRQPEEALGQAAMDAVFAKLDVADSDLDAASSLNTSHLFPASLSVRESTGKALT